MKTNQVKNIFKLFEKSKKLFKILLLNSRKNLSTDILYGIVGVLKKRAWTSNGLFLESYIKNL